MREEKRGLRTGILVTGFLILVMLLAGPALAAAPLDPHTIPKFVTHLEPLAHWTPTDVNGTDYYEIDVAAFTEPILPPDFTAANCTTNCFTPQFGYGGRAHHPLTGADLGFIRHAPSATFEAVRNRPTQVKWINNLGTNTSMYAVDPTLHWADPNGICTTNPDKTCTMSSTVPMGTGMCMYDTAAGACMFMCPIGGCSVYPPGYDAAQAPVPIVSHLHGGEVQSTSDGNPESWWTSNGIHGKGYNGGPAGANYAIFDYPNQQPPTNLWYHDHALGITRTNVMSGLAGFYFIRDPANEPNLPDHYFEQELVIQDRSFMDDGTLNFPYNADNPDLHPYWLPEFFGDTITVNGDTWPNMNVTQDVYRLRLLDGSNARFYNLMLVDNNTGVAYPFYQIGTDGGYLNAPVQMMNLTFAPGERADVLVDFSQFPVGTKFIFNNSAAAPFPMGDPANFDPTTTGIIMQFTVIGPSTSDEGLFQIPATLTPIVPPPNLADSGLSRTLTLKEVEGLAGPVEVLLNGQKWGADISELPALGTTEDWYIVDLTPDAHPIHTHLTQFQLISRQDINVTAYEADWLALNGNQTIPFPANYKVQQLPVTNYLLGTPTGPDANEMGWKDTIKMQPGQVSRIRIRFAPIDGVQYPFPASVGPGYVWHCHILDHEDNEMMRPYAVTSSSLLVCKENVTRSNAVVGPLSGWDFAAVGATAVGQQVRTKQTTGATGCTNFTELMPGTFTVTETPQSLWINVSPLTQQKVIGANDQATLTFKNRYMDLWCGKNVAFWKTEILKFLNNNPPQSRKVCAGFFNADNLAATGMQSWRAVYSALYDGANDKCQAKADAQKLALVLDQQYYGDGLKFRVDTDKISSDDSCKATLRSACGGNSQCSVISIFNNWPTNCQTAQKVGQCLGNYSFGCQGNFPPNYCSVS